MKRFFVIIIILFSHYLIGQKNYKINSSTWLYTAPITYISKIDNFEKERKKGEKYLKKEEKEVTFSTDDVILLSLQKKDSSTNVIFVTYKNNFNIKNHTLNGYAQILKEILIRNGKNEYPNNESSVTVDEILIDKIKFNVIRQTIFFNDENYIGTKDFYIAEIDEKEFMIVVANVNEEDRKNVKNSILNSTFKN